MRLYRTTEVDELHIVGPDGLPKHHAVAQTLVAVVPFRTYTFRFDAATTEAAINYVQPGTASTAYTDADGNGAIDITLPHEVAAGTTCTLDFEATFAYHTTPPPVFRRFTGEDGLKCWNVSVHFPLTKEPAEIYWAEWTGYGPDAQVVAGSQERYLPEILDPQAEETSFAVMREMHDVPPGKVFGFYWSWGA